MEKATRRPTQLWGGFRRRALIWGISSKPTRKAAIPAMAAFLVLARGSPLRLAARMLARVLLLSGSDIEAGVAP